MLKHNLKLGGAGGLVLLCVNLLNFFGGATITLFSSAGVYEFQSKIYLVK